MQYLQRVTATPG